MNSFFFFLLPEESSIIQPINIFEVTEKSIKDDIVLISNDSNLNSHLKQYKKKKISKYNSYLFSLKGNEFYITLNKSGMNEDAFICNSIGSIEYRHMKYQLNADSKAFQLINQEFFHQFCFDFNQLNINAFQSLDGLRNYLVIKKPKKAFGQLNCLILLYNSNHILAFYDKSPYSNPKD